MKNLVCFIIGFITVAFVLLMGEAGREKVERKDLPDYQAYSRKQVMEELR